jgi:hypothetical protein
MVLMERASRDQHLCYEKTLDISVPSCNMDRFRLDTSLEAAKRQNSDGQIRKAESHEPQIKAKLVDKVKRRWRPLLEARPPIPQDDLD